MKIIQCDRLLEFSWLVHGSTTRFFNPTPGGKIDELSSLARLWEIEPQAFLFANQKHTNHVFFLGREEGESPGNIAHFQNSDSGSETDPEGDSDSGMVGKKVYLLDRTDAVGTDMPGILTCIFTADCVPIILVDTWERRVMLVHAGWRGTLSRIAQKALETLVQRGTKPENLIAWLGPAIGPCCYEVSIDLIREFRKQFPEIDKAFQGRYLDLSAVNARQLVQSGIPRKNIHIEKRCTKCNRDLLYSYRGGDGKRRILTAAYIHS